MIMRTEAVVLLPFPLCGMGRSNSLDLGVLYICLLLFHCYKCFVFHVGYLTL